jgi:hypothetical protein
MVDWISLSVVAAGLAIYFSTFKFIPIVFMIAYGGRMLIAVLSYKIFDVYRIDSGKIGPTEVRILMALALLVEFFLTGSLLVLIGLATVSLLIVNVVEFWQLLKKADGRDRANRTSDWGKSPQARPSRIIALRASDSNSRKQAG